MSIELSRSVVVFDLDDTLYPEADYVISGIRHVSEKLTQLYKQDIYFQLHGAILENPKIDWLDLTCRLLKLPPSAKESLLWMYRLHVPNIGLTAACSMALEEIRSTAIQVAILTDGRSITQRLKLHALGLNDWPLYISEDHGSLKPDTKRFITIQESFPAENYVYIGDNPQKDFIGCNSLGWQTIGMRGNGSNIHPQEIKNLTPTAGPSYWADSWGDVCNILRNK